MEGMREGPQRRGNRTQRGGEKGKERGRGGGREEEEREEVVVATSHFLSLTIPIGTFPMDKNRRLLDCEIACRQTNNRPLVASESASTQPSALRHRENKRNQ